jgi:hypothetical protein
MLLMATAPFIFKAAMNRTPLQTLLAERLQSARGLGWGMPETPPFGKGGSTEAGAPAWFRLAYLALRSLGLARG